MSYLKSYVEGRLSIYSPPEGWFTPGGNGVGIVHEVGPEVYHLKPGQRVLVSSHVVADENVPEPAQFLLGVTAGVRTGRRCRRTGATERSPNMRDCRRRR